MKWNPQLNIIWKCFELIVLSSAEVRSAGTTPAISVTISHIVMAGCTVQYTVQYRRGEADQPIKHQIELFCVGWKQFPRECFNELCDESIIKTSTPYIILQTRG